MPHYTPSNSPENHGNQEGSLSKPSSQIPADATTPHSFNALVREILARSDSDNWDDAKREWYLASIFFSPPDELGTCLCGHPIREHCVLRNHLTGDEVVVGNVCINKFLQLDTDKLFAAFRKIIQSSEAALSVQATEYAFDNGWINAWERKFCLDTCRKRRMTHTQLAKRIELNLQIAGYLTEGRTAHA